MGQNLHHMHTHAYTCVHMRATRRLVPAMHPTACMQPCITLDRILYTACRDVARNPIHPALFYTWKGSIWKGYTCMPESLQRVGQTALISQSVFPVEMPKEGCHAWDIPHSPSMQSNPTPLKAAPQRMRFSNERRGREVQLSNNTFTTANLNAG